MSGTRRLKVRVKSEGGLVFFDAKKKEFRFVRPREKEFMPQAKPGEKSREFFRYSDPDRIIRLYLLYQPSTCTLIGSLTLIPGSPGERALTELLRNRKVQGKGYALAQMMSEVAAYHYRRQYGENSARAAAPGEEGYFCWSSPTVDLGVPRVLLFSAGDMMYLSGCCDSFSGDLFAEELTVACQSLSVGYQCHVTMCEFFDSFAAVWAETRKKAASFLSDVPPPRRLLATMDAGKTREFFRRMDRACQLRQRIQQEEETLEDRMWQELLQGEEEREGFPGVRPPDRES